MKTAIVQSPTRLSVVVLDMNKLRKGIAGGGGIGISPAHYMRITISMIYGDDDVVFAINKLTVCHYIELFRNAFNTQTHYGVSIESDVVMHCGEGSTTSTICGLLRGLSAIHDMELSDEELLKMYYSGIKEEHDGKLVGGYASGMGAWNVIHGGIVLVDERANLVKALRINDDYNVLIVRPKNMNRISYETESILIDGVGRKSDISYKEMKQELFERVVDQCETNSQGNQTQLLRLISKFNEIGSKADEFSNADKLNGGLLRHLKDQGIAKNVTLHGLSSLGPTYYYVDTKRVLLSISYCLDRNVYETYIYRISEGISTVVHDITEG